MRLIFILILVAVQITLFWITFGHYRTTGKPRWMLALLSVALLATTAPLFGILLWRVHLQQLPEVLIYAGVYPFYLWHFASVIVFLFWLISQLVRAPLAAVRLIFGTRSASRQGARSAPDDPPRQFYDSRRRIFLRQGFAASAGVLFTGAAYSAYRTDEYEVNSVSMPVKGLPPEFEGFSIALISDIHSSVFMLKEQMQEYAAVVNSLGADLIAVPGDFVNSELDEVYPFAEAFSGLSAPYGVYGVLGNHDFYTKQVGIVAAEVEQCGITLLRNRHVIIEKGGKQLALLGIDDATTFRYSIPYFERASQGVPAGIPRVLLSHRPNFFDHAAVRNVDVTLAGHTHGGQVVLGKLGEQMLTPAGFASKYLAGLYAKGGSQLYVSRGIGTVGVPFRFNCPPEITKVVLTRS